MSTAADTAQKAILAINAVATVPGAPVATRLIALHQLERHLQGHIRKLGEDGQQQVGKNPVNQGDHE